MIGKVYKRDRINGGQGFGIIIGLIMGHLTLFWFINIVLLNGDAFDLTIIIPITMAILLGVGIIILRVCLSKNSMKKWQAFKQSKNFKENYWVDGPGSGANCYFDDTNRLLIVQTRDISVMYDYDNIATANWKWSTKSEPLYSYATGWIGSTPVSTRVYQGEDVTYFYYVSFTTQVDGAQNKPKRWNIKVCDEGTMNRVYEKFKACGGLVEKQDDSSKNMLI